MFPETFQDATKELKKRQKKMFNHGLLQFRKFGFELGSFPWGVAQYVFLQFSSSYFRVRVVIKVVVFLRFYGVVQHDSKKHICQYQLYLCICNKEYNFRHIYPYIIKTLEDFSFCHSFNSESSKFIFNVKYFRSMVSMQEDMVLKKLIFYNYETKNHHNLCRILPNFNNEGTFFIS